MKKKCVLVCLIFVLASAFLFSLELAGTMWGPEKGGNGFYLKFEKNGEFTFIYSGEGGGQNVRGRYTQNGNELTLVPVVIEEWGDLPEYIKREIHCLIEETDSLFSNYKITSNVGLELWLRNYRANDGEKRIVDGNVIYVLNTIGTINESARVREGPGLKFNHLGFSFDDDPAKYYSLPKGSRVAVLGSSEVKTVVDGVEDCWYYCTFDPNMWETVYGWIWGGLVSF